MATTSKERALQLAKDLKEYKEIISYRKDCLNSVLSTLSELIEEVDEKISKEDYELSYTWDAEVTYEQVAEGLEETFRVAYDGDWE